MAGADYYVASAYDAYSGRGLGVNYAVNSAPGAAAVELEIPGLPLGQAVRIYVQVGGRCLRAGGLLRLGASCPAFGLELCVSAVPHPAARQLHPAHRPAPWILPPPARPPPGVRRRRLRARGL